MKRVAPALARLVVFACFLASLAFAGSDVDRVRVVPLPRNAAPKTAATTPAATPVDAETLSRSLALALRAASPGARPAEAAAKRMIELRGDRALSATAARGARPRFGSGTPMELVPAPTRSSISYAPPEPLGDLAIAREFLREHRDVLRIDDPDAELLLERREIDDLGRRHLRFSQQYGGVPVWPADVVVHLDSAGRVDVLNGAYIPTPRRLPREPLVTAAAAAARARKEIYGDRDAASGAPELIVYAAADRAPRLAWKVEVSGGLASAWTVVIDALQGDPLTAISRVHEGAVNGSGTDLAGATRPLRLWQDGAFFYLVDTGKPMYDPSSTPPSPEATRGAIIILDSQNQPPSSNPSGFPERVPIVASSSPTSWSIREGVSAAYWLSQTYDYYAERHGRNSLDGAGGTLTGLVRYGRGFDNAFWRDDLNLMVFGDGDTWAGSLDFVGHEMSHGVTSRTSNLVYQGQSGALNEAFSDILGEMIEARSYGSPDWIMGSQLNFKHRNLANPALIVNPLTVGAGYPTKMSELFATTEDNGGVHINSSIINRAYYLYSTGLPGAVGLRDAEKVFYRALTTHLVRKSEFLDARLAVIRSAGELFGAGSQQALKAAEAFDAVEIFDASAPPPPPPIPEVAAPDSTTFAFFEQGQWLLGRRETALGDGAAGAYLSKFAVAQSRPTVSGDGSLAVFVDATNDLCLIPTDGSAAAETCLGLPQQGVRVQSVGMSPDGSRFGFVLKDALGNPDNRIIVVDVATDQAVTFELEAPAFDSISTTAVAFADAMDFSADGQFLIYDAFNVIEYYDGSEIGAWSIYALHLESGITLPLLPPVPGLDIEYPSLGQTDESLLVFEVVNPSTGVTTIAATDLDTGEAVAVAQVNAGFGVPSYTGDDSAVVFSHAAANDTGANLYRQALAADGLTPQGSPTLWIESANYGAIYRRGSFSGPTMQSGTIQLQSSTLNASEGAVATVTVQRTGGNKGAASVVYATSNGTATGGSDYQPASGTLTWSDGDMEAKSFQVRINRDGASEPKETVRITLSNATGASLGTPATATLNIANKAPSKRARTARR